MTNREIDRGNKLIDKFMLSFRQNLSISKPYHASFDTLMEVVWQIEQITTCSVEINDGCEIFYWYNKKTKKFDSITGKHYNIWNRYKYKKDEFGISAIWEKQISVLLSIVQFIKWYNKKDEKASRKKQSK